MGTLKRVKSDIPFCTKFAFNTCLVQKRVELGPIGPIMQILFEVRVGSYHVVKYRIPITRCTAQSGIILPEFLPLFQSGDISTEVILLI